MSRKLSDDVEDHGRPPGEGGYDIGYENCPCFWGREPGSLVKASLSVLPPRKGLRVLDAGCGEGKNAAFFARQGAVVDAFDISPAAIRNAKAAWDTDAERATFEVGDVGTVAVPEREYDIVVSYGLLHCIDGTSGKIEAVERLKRATRHGGTHIVCALNSRLDGFREGHIGFRPQLESHAFYLSLYEECEVTMASDSDLCESHPPNQVQHVHAVSRFLARCP